MLNLYIVVHVFFLKAYEIRIQARLFFDIYDFEAHIMFNFSGYQTIGMKKFNSNVAAKCEYIFSDL